MINRPIDTPDQLRKSLEFLAARIELSYERLYNPDRYTVTITYRKQTIVFETACLESDFPVPTPYGALMWLHVMALNVQRKTIEEYGKTWHESGRRLEEKYAEAQARVQTCAQMFGAGFVTNWETRW